MDKECTEFRCHAVLFVSGGSLETATLETPKTLIFAHCSQHVPIRCNALCREMRRQLSLHQGHCSPPQASSSFHVVFVVLPPSFVSPKLQVFNQRLIQNILWMCPWTQYPTTPILRATQSTVRRNCPVCRRCFRNIPLQNTLPTIALQLTALLSFRNRRLCAALVC